jgi:hypothetical protein
MKKIRIGLIVAGIIIIIVNLILLDYSNLKWTENSGSYGAIIASCIGIIGMVYSIRYDKKNK